ncbi:hypothetical protein B0T22DRAFT_503462 [Podospora appendiculata]|uniref:Cytoplasmic tRNA 2-thiolation protein 2 n=1 Tax=Podospora appendiculata TaxID=314037 RepID=A0AAE0XFR1_9PEZI|nr:hypothetical protein B0T22DRAFT_503462 [Podospora appendiculata]
MLGSVILSLGCSSAMLSGISPIIVRSNGSVIIGGSSRVIDLRVGFWGICFGPQPFACTSSLTVFPTKTATDVARAIPLGQGGGNVALTRLALGLQANFAVLSGIVLFVIVCADLLANLVQVYFSTRGFREEHIKAALWARSLDWAAAAIALSTFSSFQSLVLATPDLLLATTNAASATPLIISAGTVASNLFAAIVGTTIAGAFVNTFLTASDAGFDAYRAAKVGQLPAKSLATLAKPDTGNQGFVIRPRRPAYEVFPPFSPLCLNFGVGRVSIDCFAKHVSTKCIKQIATLGKETRGPLGPSTGTGPPTSARRGYLVGLSLGVSSTVLIDLLNDNVDFQLSRGRAAPFELTAVHVDASSLDSSSPSTTTPEQTLEAYRRRYPRFTFLSIPLQSALTLPTIDWTALPTLDRTLPTTATAQQLRALFAGLPSTTARADLRRILTRHVLVAAARAHGCATLLLGHSTTALAELTLAEAAKGRGFSLPWQINDGTLPVVEYPLSPSPSPSPSTTTILIHHPLRDLLRKELATYAAKLTTPPLTDLIPPAAAADPTTAPVVSHKDLTIEEVMRRYFADVEENYPSVVANVARTTGKLVRLGGAEAGAGAGASRCGVCSMPLDEQGDERWRGELGGDPVLREGVAGRLCYGCERSTRG